MKKHISIILSLLLLAACGHKNEFTLSGTLTGGEGKMVYLEELTPEGPLFIDSIRLDKKGAFSYRYRMPYESYYNLHVSENDYVVLLPQGGEKIRISGDYSQLDRTYDVSGSPESSLLWQLQKYSNMGAETLTEIIALDQRNKTTLSGQDSLAAREVTDSLFRDAFKDQYQFLTRFIRDNRGSLATIIALYKPFNGNMPIIDAEHNMDWYEEVLEGLEELKPTNPHTQHFALGVAALRHKFPQQ